MLTPPQSLSSFARLDPCKSDSIVNGDLRRLSDGERIGGQVGEPTSKWISEWVAEWVSKWVSR